MSDLLFSRLDEYGVLIIFATVLAGQLGIPIPAIAVLMGAGALAGEDRTAAAAFALSALAGCILADCAWFAIGRRYGLRALVTLYRLARLTDASARRIQRGFERYGSSSLIAAKFIPGLSLIAPPLAGALRMSWFTFVFFSGIGSLLWVISGVGIGIVLADEIPEILEHLGEIGRITLPIVLLVAVGYLVRYWWLRYRLQARR
jgi:membrane protein DedA with SNARE-associated domain